MGGRWQSIFNRCPGSRQTAWTAGVFNRDSGCLTFPPNQVNSTVIIDGDLWQSSKIGLTNRNFISGIEIQTAISAASEKDFTFYCPIDQLPLLPDDNDQIAMSRNGDITRRLVNRGNGYTVIEDWGRIRPSPLDTSQGITQIID